MLRSALFFLLLSVSRCVDNQSSRFVVYQKQQDQVSPQSAVQQPSAQVGQPSTLPVQDQAIVPVIDNTDRKNQQFFSSDLYRPESPKNIEYKAPQPQTSQFKTEVVNLNSDQPQASYPYKIATSEQKTSKSAISRNDDKSSNINNKVNIKLNNDKSLCYLQVGVFSGEENANILIKEIKLSSKLSAMKKIENGKIKVLVGPFKTEEDLLKIKEKLASGGEIKSFKVCN